jgi:hypothetical protein
MQKIRDRRAREHDPVGAGKPTRRRGVSIRLIAAVIAFATAAGATASVAEGMTGGASGYAPSVPPSGGEVAFSPFRVAGASWYGPGLYGSKTACGATLLRRTLGVAHRSLPCGTTVKFVYHGRALVTQVIDRGPYVHGRAWDLTQAASEALDLEGVGRVQYAVALNYARPHGGR